VPRRILGKRAIQEITILNDDGQYCVSSADMEIGTGHTLVVWPGGRLVRALTCDAAVLGSAQLSRNNLTQVLHAIAPRHQAVQFRTGRAVEMPCGWEGNRRFGVRLKELCARPSLWGMAHFASIHVVRLDEMGHKVVLEPELNSIDGFKLESLR